MLARFSILVFLLIMLPGCKKRIEQYGEPFADLMINGNGVFRGIHLGASIEDVAEYEVNNTIAEEDSMSVTYELTLGTSGECSVKYDFEDGRISAIEANATFENTNEGKELHEGFIKYFSSIYGPSQSEKGVLVWKINQKGPDYGALIEMIEIYDTKEASPWVLNIYKPSNSETAAPDSMLNL